MTAPIPKPATLAMEPRFAGDDDPPVVVGGIVLKLAEGLYDEDGMPAGPETVMQIQTEWHWDDADTPAPTPWTADRYPLDVRDVGHSILVSDRLPDGTVMVSGPIGPVEAGVSGSAPLVDDAGNLLPADEQPADALLPPPPHFADESITQDEETTAPEGAAAREAPAASETGSWPKRHAALDEIGNEVGVEFEPDATVEQKIAALEAAGYEPSVE